MSWSSTCYGQFPDEATARAVAAQLGAEFPEDGSIPTGSDNYSLKAPIVEKDEHGDPLPGYWAMARFNLDTPDGAAAHTQFCAMPYYVQRADPNNVFL